MFLTIGLLVFPSRLIAVAGVSLIVSGFLILIARPMGVFLSLALAKMQTQEKVLISWVGLRGAAPIILATFPLVAGLPASDLFFDIVFFIVITSVLLQGTLIPVVARRLGLESDAKANRPSPLEFVPTTRTMSDLVEVIIPENSPVSGKRVVDLRLPKSALIVLLGRGEEFIAPRGATSIQSGDRLLILSDKREIAGLRALLAPAGPKDEMHDSLEI